MKTPSGVIDIFGKDQKGNYVIIELKIKRPNDKVIGQITRYMGYIKEYYKVNYNQIRGIIICRDITHKLVYSAKFVRNLELLKFIINDFNGVLSLLPHFPDELNPIEHSNYQYKDSFGSTRRMVKESMFRSRLLPNGELIESRF